MLNPLSPISQNYPQTLAVRGRQIRSYQRLPATQTLKGGKPTNLAPKLHKSPPLQPDKRRTQKRPPSPLKPGRCPSSPKQESPQKRTSPTVKKLIQKSISKLQHQKEQRLKQQEDLDRLQVQKRLHLKKKNEGIRRRNAKGKRRNAVHKRPWGVDQRQPDHFQSNKQLRSKVRLERERFHKEGRARIGLDGFKVKPRKHRFSKQTSPLISKERDPSIGRYMKLKKQQSRIVKITEKLEELLRENERERALFDLDRKARESFRKTSKRRRNYSEQRPVKAQKHINYSQQITPLAEDSSDFDEQSEAAVRIQRWWRTYQLTKASEVSQSSRHKSWEDIAPDQAGSEIVNQFRRALNERHLEIDRLLTPFEEQPSDSSQTPPARHSLAIPALKLGELRLESDEEEFFVYENDESEASSYASSESSRGATSESMEALPKPVFGASPAMHGGEPDDVPVAAQDPDVLHSKLSELLEPKEPPKMMRQYNDKFKADSQIRLFEKEASFLLTSEIDSYLNIISFENREKEVNPGWGMIREVLAFLLEHLLKDQNEMLDIINTPLYPDPLQRLCILQNSDIGGLIKVPTMDLILMPEHYTLMKKVFNTNALASRDIYIQMLFDCFNEALNYVRPYGIEGVPPPWSRRTLKVLGENSLLGIFEVVEAMAARWSAARLGQRHDKVKRVAEERMAGLLAADVRELESRWQVYEDEEVQVAFDVTDTILDALAGEIAYIMP